MKKDALAQLIGTGSGRRAISAASPVFFDKYYLKMSPADHRTNWLNTIDRLEKEAKESGQKKKLLVLSPRSHGKSLLAASYALRKICLDRNVSILFISASSGQAEKRVRLIKTFMDSEVVQQDWCGEDCIPFDGGSAKFTATQIYVQRAGKSVDPTLEAVGAGGSITGAHVDVVIIDDLEDERTCASAGVRQKTRDWLGATVTPILNQGGLMLVIGTRKHEDDIYGHMINDPTFEIIEEPAIVEWPSHYEYIVDKMDNGREVLKDVVTSGDEKVLWPEFRDIKYLLMERRSMGSTLFEREMQNKVIAAEDSIIKSDWIQECKTSSYSFDMPPPQIKLDKCIVAQGWDLAIESDAKKAAKNDTDYTVGWTVAKDPKTGIIWVLDAYRGRGLTQQQIMDEIVKMYNKWSGYVRRVAVEKNSFGALHVSALMKDTDLPVRGVNMTRKNSLKLKIHRLAVLFENKLIRLPYMDESCRRFVDAFEEEAITYPFGKHDDTLTSMKWAIEEVEANSGNYSVSFGTDMYGSDGELIEKKRAEKSLDDFWMNFRVSDDWEEHADPDYFGDKKDDN